MEELPGQERPSGPRPDTRGVGEWLEWFGIGRLLATALVVGLIGVGAVWLLRSPPPDVASGLSVATTAPSDASTIPSPPGSTVTIPALVVVHVTGAVRHPGVYELPPGARVRDALVVAGGARAGADESLLNLAAPVVDGSRIQVPEVGEEVVTVQVPGGDTAVDATTAPIDVNRATAAELESLPGVGPATAAAIITERETNGPFLSVDDVERVPGIGPARLAAIRDLIVT